jgi:hypothetical protein
MQGSGRILILISDTGEEADNGSAIGKEHVNIIRSFQGARTSSPKPTRASRSTKELSLTIPPSSIS